MDVLNQDLERAPGVEWFDSRRRAEPMRSDRPGRPLRVLLADPHKFPQPA